MSYKRTVMHKGDQWRCRHCRGLAGFMKHISGWGFHPGTGEIMQLPMHQCHRCGARYYRETLQEIKLPLGDVVELLIELRERTTRHLLG